MLVGSLTYCIFDGIVKIVCTTRFKRGNLDSCERRFWSHVRRFWSHVFPYRSMGGVLVSMFSVVF